MARQARRHRQGQRRRRRGRDGEVARRAAGALRRDGVGACTSPRGTRSRSARRSSPSTTAAIVGPRGRRPPTPPAEDVEEGLIGGTTSTGRTAVLVGYGVKQTEAKRRPRSTPAPLPAQEPGRRAGPGRYPWRARLAKPPVRKLAKDLGVDLGSVTPTGDGRRRHPRRRRGGRRGRAATTAHRRTTAGAGRARDPRAHQGRAQDDRAGDGRLGVHRPARHRVGHRRRHRDDGARRAAQEATRSSATSRSPRSSSSPRRCAWPCAATPGQRDLGRGRAGDRAQALRQPRHRRRHPARPRRPEHQGRRPDVDASSSPRRSAR